MCTMTAHYPMIVAAFRRESACCTAVRPSFLACRHLQRNVLVAESTEPALEMKSALQAIRGVMIEQVFPSQIPLVDWWAIKRFWMV